MSSTTTRPLAEIIKDHVESMAGTEGDEAKSQKPLIVGIAGAVSAGKSTLSSNLKQELENMGHSTTVIGSDSFLMSNAELKSKGLSQRKGFPETYNEDEVKRFIQLLREIQNESDPITIPVYDHLTYDIKETERLEVDKSSKVVLFEGINALRFADLLDLKIYVDAKEEDLRNWFYHRWITLREKSKTEPSEFLKSFDHLDDEGFQNMLTYVWENINLPNIEQHIEPTKDAANIIVKKAADHSIEEIIRR